MEIVIEKIDNCPISIGISSPINIGLWEKLKHVVRYLLKNEYLYWNDVVISKKDAKTLAKFISNEFKPKKTKKSSRKKIKNKKNI